LEISNDRTPRLRFTQDVTTSLVVNDKIIAANSGVSFFCVAVAGLANPGLILKNLDTKNRLLYS
jgi:hypothetical protein